MARGAVVGGVGGGGGAAQGGEAEALRQHHARGGGGCGGGVLAGAGVDHQLCGHLTTLLLGSGNMGQLEHTCTQRGYPSILGTVFHEVVELYWPFCGWFFFIEGRKPIREKFSSPSYQTKYASEPIIASFMRLTYSCSCCLLIRTQ